MKSRSRPPLVLKDAEPGADDATVAAEADAPAVEAVIGDAAALPVDLEATSSLPAVQSERPGARAAYPLAIVGALLWVGGVAAYAAYQLGRGQIELGPETIALLSLVALAPAGLSLLVAHLLRQASALAVEARRARAMADALGMPTALAAQDSSQAMLSLRSDIELSTRAAMQAREEMMALRTAMEVESKRLNDAAEAAQRTARRLADQMAKESATLGGVGQKLETQTQDVIDTVERQARMVADASDLAQTQLREAEAALAARAADMASAAGGAQDAAKAAADDLARQTIRLETAGTGVADQIRTVEEGLSEQRAALVQVAFGLRRDQEDFSAQVESQRAQLSESLSHARAASGEMSEGAVQSSNAVQALVEAAADQVKALGELAHSEAQTFDARTREALDRFEDLAAQVRETSIQESERTLAQMQQALEEARVTSDAAVTEARARIERLNEDAFAAGKAADEVIEARLATSRRAIEETAALGDETSQKLTNQLAASLTEARGVLEQITTSLTEIDERARRLPEESQARIEEVRGSVESSLAALSESSRRIAQESESADAAFHDRVKRNYDMLAEAVRLMGVVSGETLPAARREASPPPPPALDEGLRGRLQLGPTEKDDAVRQAFEPSGPIEPPPETLDARPWRELLAQPPEVAVETPPLDAAPPSAPDDDPELANRINGVIRELGIDPNALLPRTRVDEAIAAWRVNDVASARQMARNVAPAAVRRISRRVLTDRALLSDVETYIRQYSGNLRARASEAEGTVLSDLLQSDAGRAFLLIDAAIGDIG